MIVEALLALGVALVVLFCGLGFGLRLLPGALSAVRRRTNRTRRLSARWCAVAIPDPYPPLTRQANERIGWWRRLRAMVTDRATWRDLLWLILDPLVGWFMTLAPAALILWGLFGVVMPAVWKPIVDAHGNNWYAMIHVDGPQAAWLSVPLGVAGIALGLWAAPWLLARYGRFAHSLLAPTQQAELQIRASRLEETRSTAIDSRAAELRRIEEDLHHGALSRLNAMGMTLKSAEEVLVRSPEAAGALLAEARRSSAAALAELRDLVRSIHPPVLADRGLGDAIRAMALDSPLKIEVAVDLPGRVDPPVESAAYFAVRELLANAQRTGARRAWIDVRYANGLLLINITDDRTEDTAASRESELHAIERRLGAFDGILAMSKRHGELTMAAVEVPGRLI